MNKKNLFILKSMLFFSMIILLNGCSSMSLYYEKPAVKKMNNGKIFITVDDQRPPDYGSNEPSRVGTIRNTFGMPFALNAQAGREPLKVIKELTSDCLNAAGYSISEKPNGVPQLNVILKAFWSDGYVHNRVWSEIIVKLQKGKNNRSVWTQTFKGDVGITMKIGLGALDEAINSMLEGIKNEMIAEFSKSKFNKSVKSVR